MATLCTGPKCSHSVDLFESTDGNPSARIDTTAGVIHGVKVLGFQSRATGITIGLDPAQFGDAVYEPYEYSREAVAKAAPLYEGCRVYIDHPEFSYRADGERVPSQRDRKLSEVFGRLVNVRLGETGLFADLEYVQNHPLAPQIVELAEKYPELLALSHNARGEPELQNGKLVITEISDVRSVDIVGERPGTTNSLFETEPKQMADNVLEAPMKPVGDNVADKVLVNADNGGMKQVPEDAPVMGPGDGTMTTEDAPGDAPATDHFDAAFKTEMDAIWDGEGTAKDKAKKIQNLLKLKGLLDDYRGSGDDTTDAPVGDDLDETEPEPQPKEDDKKLPEAAPCDTDKKPMTETAPKVQPTKRANFKPLMETVVGPTIRLMNEMSVPVTEATFMAVANTPAKLRRNICATLAETTPRRAVARSQGGAVGVVETSPGANGRPKPKVAVVETAPIAPKLTSLSNEDVAAYLRSGRMPVHAK